MRRCLSEAWRGSWQTALASWSCFWLWTPGVWSKFELASYASADANHIRVGRNEEWGMVNSH
jgi:hypothetical protein